MEILTIKSIPTLSRKDEINLIYQKISKGFTLLGIDGRQERLNYTNKLLNSNIKSVQELDDQKLCKLLFYLADNSNNLLLINGV